jgi:hypothetical protein
VPDNVEARTWKGFAEHIEDRRGVHHVADPIQLHDQDAVDVRSWCAPERDEPL